MFCPTCGEDAGDGAFCPSCGTDLRDVRRVAQQGTRGKTTGGRGRGSAGGPAEAAGNGKPAAAGRVAGRAPRGAAARRNSWLPWLVAGIIVAVVAVVIVVQMGGDGAQPADTAGGGGQGLVPAPDADTSGTYEQLVQRANGLYDQGSSLFQTGDPAAAGEYFTAAATVYEAAWEKQSGDPNVGTDWATSLFYSGDIEGALSRVDKVLAANPEFQPGHYNRGNYLEHQARVYDEEGDAQAAARTRKEALAAFRRAEEIDPASDIGKQAAERMKDLESL